MNKAEKHVYSELQLGCLVNPNKSAEIADDTLTILGGLKSRLIFYHFAREAFFKKADKDEDELLN